MHSFSASELFERHPYCKLFNANFTCCLTNYYSFHAGNYSIMLLGKGVKGLNIPFEAIVRYKAVDLNGINLNIEQLKEELENHGSQVKITKEVENPVPYLEGSLKGKLQIDHVQSFDFRSVNLDDSQTKVTK